MIRSWLRWLIHGRPTHPAPAWIQPGTRIRHTASDNPGVVTRPAFRYGNHGGYCRFDDVPTFERWVPAGCLKPEDR